MKGFTILLIPVNPGQLAMVEETKSKEFTASNAIGSAKQLSYYVEIGVINHSPYTIIAGDSNGNYYTIFPTKLLSQNSQTCEVFKRHIDGKEREFSSYGAETSSKGFPTNSWIFDVKGLLSEKYVYISELGWMFSLSEQIIAENHPKLQHNIDAITNSKIQQYLAAVNTAPIKIFANDSTGTIKELWLSIGNHVICVGITTDKLLSSHCRIVIGMTLGNYNEYEMDLSKIIDGTEIECVTKDGVICVAPTEYQVRQWLFDKVNTIGETYTKAQLNKIVTRETTQLQIQNKELQYSIERLEVGLNRASNELKTYRELDAIRETKGLEHEKIDFEREKRNFERLKMELSYKQTEIESTNKELTNKLSTITAVAKATAVIAPICFGFFMWLYKHKT